MPESPTVHFEFKRTGARFRLVYENGDSEQLALTSVGPDLYRMDESSFAGNAVYRDVIRTRVMADGALLFVEIAEHSTLTTQSFILSAETLPTERIQSILNRVMEAGGMWEQAFGGVLIVHTPAGVAESIGREITHNASKG
jgi:hypothetical protein